jgi:hypothetical protein
MKEIEEKKKKVAKKMKGTKDIIESDFNRRDLTEDKFGKKDFKKEKKERKDKDEMGKHGQHDWEI